MIGAMWRPRRAIREPERNHGNNGDDPTLLREYQP